ncbi:MAG: RNA-directed DNA polymerase [Holophagales bacterium]|nr:MAG: RNA-directed DNA polymerase [Holophagales bacterium]
MKPPPFFVSFRTAADYRAALGDGVAELYWPDIGHLGERRLPPVVSVRALACLFGVSSKFVGALRRNPERYYRSFVIRTGRKKRQIHSPKVGLKVFQKWFGTHLAAALEFDPWVFGFVPGRSAPMAARVHARARWIYSVDLADFFPSVSRTRVVGALQGLGYPGHGAELAASLCCYGEGLAQGSPASPVLSNLVFREQDQQLHELAREFGARLTRYADDIVFSGQAAVPAGLPDRVKAVVTAGGWDLNDAKEELAESPIRLKVHGLVVHGDRPRLTKGYRNRIRALRHLSAVGKVRSEDAARVAGHLRYADSIDRLSEEE